MTLTEAVGLSYSIDVLLTWILEVLLSEVLKAQC